MDVGRGVCEETVLPITLDEIDPDLLCTVELVARSDVVSMVLVVGSCETAELLNGVGTCDDRATLVVKGFEGITLLEAVKPCDAVTSALLLGGVELVVGV